MLHGAAPNRAGWRGPTVAVLAILLTITLVKTARAAVTLQSTVAVNNATPASQISITVPAVVVGDVLVAHIVVAKDLPTTNAICPPPGWTSVMRTNHQPNSSVPPITKFSQEIFYFVPSASAGSTPHIWRFRSNNNCTTGTLQNRGASGAIVRYSGADTSDPIDAFADAGVTSGSSTTATAPAVVTSLAGARVLRFFSAFKSTTFNNTSPPMRLYTVGSTNNSAERTAAGYHQTLPAGNTNDFPVTFGSSAEWLAATVALNPAVSNTPPTLTNVPTSATICELADYTFDGNASDSNVPAQTLTFSLQGTVPSGVTFDSTTGVFSWTPAENQDGGPYTFKVRVTDNGVPPMFTEQTVTLTVLEANAAPILDPIGNQTVIIGDPLTFPATGSDSDLVGGVPNALAFSLEGTVPAGASIDPSTGAFSWTPVIGQDGEHLITIRVTDDGPGNACGNASLFDEETITVTVRRQTFFLALDSDAIGPNQAPNGFSQDEVNEGIASIGQRMQLAWFADLANQGSTIALPSGQVGDEGWFALKTVLASWAATGPTTDGLRNLYLAGPGLGSGGDPEALLDGISGVTPLRFTGLGALVGRQVCAVVWKSDVSIGYDPLTGNLKGDNRGVVAFEVDGVTPAGEGSMLPFVTVKVRDAGEVCAEPLRLLTDAPDPISSSNPPDVGP